MRKPGKKVVILNAVKDPRISPLLVLLPGATSTATQKKIVILNAVEGEGPLNYLYRKRSSS
jgi:hypothetical protein